VTERAEAAVRAVALGGGHGLHSSLSALRLLTTELTAIVTVADDGGSSGVLRSGLGIPPVGDIRNCIAALADAEPQMSDVLQYRFPDDPGGGAQGLAGHALGNLLIAAMTAVEGGDFEDGVRLVNRILAVRGRVLPVTATPLTLHARRIDGSIVDGQSLIMRTSGIERVWLSPSDVRPSDDALGAIAEAELIVLGPGSLYTSLLPSLLIPAIRDAILATDATRVFVCNVATQAGETSGYDLAAHYEALLAHTAPGLVDVVLANHHLVAVVPSGSTAEPVQVRWPPTGTWAPRLVLDDLVDKDNAHHHDPVLLAGALVTTLENQRGVRHRAVVRSA
jgi:uncharacterized cofD-like protein